MLRHDHRFVDEFAEQAGDLPGREVTVGAHRLDRLQRRRAGEHREAVEEVGLICGQQVVGPCNHRLQGAVPAALVPRPTGEYGEALVEPLHQRGRRQGPGAGGGELDGQRHAVEAAAELGHGAGVRVAEPKGRIHGLCPHPEQAPGRGGQHIGGRCPFRRDTERRHRPHPLVRQPKPLA